MKPGDLVCFKQGCWGRLLSGKIGLVINVRTLNEFERNVRVVDQDQESFAIDTLVDGRIWRGMTMSTESMEAIE